MSQKKIDKHKEICDNINKVYIKKNQDYGDSVGKLYEQLGDITIFTRITDKYNRLLGILSNPDKEINYESMDDTIMDLANYALIWMMERELKNEDIKENI